MQQTNIKYCAVSPSHIIPAADSQSLQGYLTSVDARRSYIKNLTTLTRIQRAVNEQQTSQWHNSVYFGSAVGAGQGCQMAHTGGGIQVLD